MDLAPDVVQVMPLFGIATTAKQASTAGPETTELTTIVRWCMGIFLGVKCPTSAFVQVRACSLGPSCARQVSWTCAGGLPDRTWLASVLSGAAFGAVAGRGQAATVR